MELTAFASGLNALFYETDYALLSLCHAAAERAGTVLTPFFSLLTMTAWKGALLIVLSLILAAISRTRRIGVCALLALAIGALITNVLLKNFVARPRPYIFDATLQQWWEYVGAHMERGGSFPSGHATAGCAFTTGVLCTIREGKRWIPVGVVYVVLLGLSRNYLMVHYPSDVVFGILIGLAAGLIAFLIVRRIKKLQPEEQLKPSRRR